jgi:hypothetical protein
MRLHGEMKDHLFSFPGRLGCMRSRMGRKRKDGKGDRKIEAKEFSGDMILSAEIIDDNRNLRPGRRLGSGRFTFFFQGRGRKDNVLSRHFRITGRALRTSIGWRNLPGRGPSPMGSFSSPVRKVTITEQGENDSQDEGKNKAGPPFSSCSLRPG